MERLRARDSNRNEARAENESEKERSEDEAVKSDYCIVAPIDYCGPVGRSVRHFFLKLIEVGQPILVLLQRKRTPFLTKCMKGASFLGTEDFLGLWLVFLQLCVNTHLARMYIILMAISMFSVGYFKAVLRLPRPRLPLVKPLELAQDWALPSNHATIASCLPMYVWIYSYIHSAALGLSSIQVVGIFIVMCSWSFSVMFSRIYIGIHSPADVVTGGILGCFLLSVFLQIDKQLDSLISQESAPWIFFLLVIFLCRLYPSVESTDPGLSDGISVLGVAFGQVLARSLSTGPILPAVLEETAALSAQIILLNCFIRMLLAGILAGSCEFLLKPLLYSVFSSFYDVFGLDFYSGSKERKRAFKDPQLRYAKHLTQSFRIPEINLEGSKDESQTEILSRLADPHFTPSCKWNIDLPVKFTIYSILMYSIVEILPVGLGFIPKHLLQ